MRRSLYIGFFLPFMLLISSWGNLGIYAQTNDDAYLETKISPKSFDDSSWRSINEKLDYSGKAPKPKKKKEAAPAPEDDSSSGDSFEDFPDLSPLFKVILFILVIGLLGGLIFAFVQNSELNLKTDIEEKDTEEDLTSLERLEEALEQTNIDPYLHKAEQDKNYHLAIRLHFLALLKLLNETGNIHWKKDRTNRAYLNQMRSTDHYPTFRELTLVFERVWYGNYQPDETKYQLLKQQFEAFCETLKNTVSR